MVHTEWKEIDKCAGRCTAMTQCIRSVYGHLNIRVRVGIYAHSESYAKHNGCSKSSHQVFPVFGLFHEHVYQFMGLRRLNLPMWDTIWLSEGALNKLAVHLKSWPPLQKCQSPSPSHTRRNFSYLNSNVKGNPRLTLQITQSADDHNCWSRACLEDLLQLLRY
jgi:hypothetical protein